MNVSVAIDPEQAHRAVMRVVSGIILCILLAALDQTVVIPAVPAISREFGSNVDLAWILTAYLLTSTVAAPIYGKLSDLHGRRLLLMISLSLFIVTSIACALAQSVEQLCVYRALQGMGGGGLMSLAQAAIADAVSPRERARYQGYFAIAWGAASIAGPLVGGFTTEYLSWRWLFWINVPIGLRALLLCWRGLPAGVVAARKSVRFDVVGSALMTLGVTLLLLALSLGGKSYPWVSPQLLTMELIALGVLGLLVVQQRLRVDGLLPPRLFADPVLRSANVISFITAVCVFALVFSLPIMLQSAVGVDAAHSGLLLIPFMLSLVSGSFLTGQVASRIGRLKPLFIGSCLLSGVCFAAMAVGAPLWPYATLIVLSAGVSFGLGSFMVGTLMAVQSAAQPRDMGAATGGLLLLRAVGSIAGSAVAGAIIDAHVGTATLSTQAFVPVFVICALTMAVALILCLNMPDVVLRGGRVPTVLE